MIPPPNRPTIADLCAFWQERLPLPPNEQKKEVPLLWREPPHGSRHQDDAVERVTFALDFRALANASLENGGLRYETGDALFLHRPFDVPPDFWPDAPVFASHRGLDAHLSVGCNYALAGAFEVSLGLIQESLVELRREETDESPIGLIGEFRQPLSFETVLSQFSTEFGGMETVLINGRETIFRLAIMGAMTPALIAKAADAGAHAYLTGQVRDVARKEAEKRNIAVFATGHDRAEWWGLDFLAWEIKEWFPGLQTRVVRSGT